jgi:uncharacterized protein YqgC (DUF456 family)
LSSATLDLLVGLALLIGVAGLVLPILPGTVLIAGALLVWAILTGGTSAWVAFTLMALVLCLGQVLKYLLPGRSMQAAGIPGRSMMVGGAAGVVGFFLIPVVGMFIGFIGGVYVAEHVRVGTWGEARRSTWVAMKATGFSMLIELTAALVAIAIWLAALVQIH